ncbi:isopentenyl-diphosphate delta isomerase isoform X1 [Tachypleus tridentatus]|uniref:isopentenyl-diphosphate delta isomerase isoform X1 n=2 Tax=Tachypleus tridentatus TaxID=6853 RepID=UPI003FD490E9
MRRVNLLSFIRVLQQSLTNNSNYYFRREMTSGILKVTPESKGEAEWTSNTALHRCEVDLTKLDSLQRKLLEEMCIAVDDSDKPLSARSKKDCHLMQNINKGLIHRAFSVFLFNTKGELLMQQRSDFKITFPGMYTNTCCSHPLYISPELDEHEALGVKKAAQRRMEIELGIRPSQIPLDSLQYLTRIFYTATSDGVWGESEIDYILVAQKDVDLKPNKNEVKNHCYLSKDDMKVFLDNLDKSGNQVTPWFSLITKNFLFNWWDNLHNLKPFEDHATIHRLTF